jgi:hypothetical protein
MVLNLLHQFHSNWKVSLAELRFTTAETAIPPTSYFLRMVVSYSYQISGAPELQGASLFMPALDVSENVTVRAASFRRLNDLMQHGHLRKTLYPREPRAPRLINVLKALDGSLEGLPHREIAILVFNKDRVEADWTGRQNHLRDQIRRAIGYGQVLMNGGYRQFLRPTYSRQIARPDVPRV